MGTATATRSCLIVEDDADTRDALVLLLSQMHFKAAAVENRDAAVKYLRYTQPDLLIVDYWMSGLPLKPFLEAVSALKPRPRVLLITAVEDPQRLREQVSLVDRFLRKPLTPENLQHALAQLFDDDSLPGVWQYRQNDI